MTEPVAYIRKTSGGTYISQTPIGDNYGSKTDKTLPLYTKEQLRPRVKMTQAEFDEFNKYYERLNELNALEMLDRYFNFGDIPLLLDSDKFILPIANIWADYDRDNPEETIEIVPDMKWFVRSKEPDDDLQDFIFLSGSNLDDLDYLVFDYAKAFDTKEEAEKWTNPLTEAVQLPVED